jgi:trigger factor
MQVSVENTGTLGRKLTISVPAERFEKEFTSRLTKLSKQVKMSGFRPGKVPLKVVEKQYGQQITDEVTGDLIQATYIEALGQEGLRPAGGPKIEPKPVNRGEALEYTAEFEIYPEMDSLEIKGKKIERPVSEIQDEDVDRTVDSLRKQRAEWQPVDRKADDGDQVVIDFTGKLDGEPFPGGSSTDYQLELGSGSFIAGFEEGLKGLAAGAETTLKLTFPEDYHSDQLAGKEVEFDVTVKKVREAKLPEVDEEFVKSLGVASGSVEDFRNEVRANLERERDDRQRSLVRSQVMDALLDVNSKVEIPQALILEEIKRIRSERNAYAQNAAQLADDSEPSDEEREQARRRVTLALAFAEVIRSNELKVEPEFLKKRVEAMAEGYEKPEEFVRTIYADNNRRSQLESILLEELAIDKLLESADVQDKTTSFKDLVSMIRPGA